MELKLIFITLFICLIGFCLEFILRLIIEKINPELLDSIDEPDDTSSDEWLRWCDKQDKKNKK